MLRPLYAERELCLKFASLEQTPTACLEFARLWGLLDRRAAANAAEPLNYWYSNIETMQASIQNAEQHPLAIPDDGIVIARAEIVLRPGPSGITVGTRPATLLGALWLQLGQLLAGRTLLLVCDHCGGWFAAGNPGGRRRIARFCSPTCKNAWHNARRTADTALTQR
jgi:hypothetical protein